MRWVTTSAVGWRMRCLPLRQDTVSKLLWQCCPPVWSPQTPSRKCSTKGSCQLRRSLPLQQGRPPAEVVAVVETSCSSICTLVCLNTTHQILQANFGSNAAPICRAPQLAALAVNPQTLEADRWQVALGSRGPYWRQRGRHHSCSGPLRRQRSCTGTGRGRGRPCPNRQSTSRQCMCWSPLLCTLAHSCFHKCITRWGHQCCPSPQRKHHICTLRARGCARTVV